MSCVFVTIVIVPSDIDEKLAERFPVKDDPPFDMFWGNLRMPDGTVIKP